MGITNERMSLARSQTDVTLREMSELIGVSEATVQRYESGKISKVPYYAIVCYAKKFNVSPSYLMGWVDDPYDKSGSWLNLDGSLGPVPNLHKKMDLSEEEQVLLMSYRKLSTDQKEIIKRAVGYYDTIIQGTF